MEPSSLRKRALVATWALFKSVESVLTAGCEPPGESVTRQNLNVCRPFAKEAGTEKIVI